MRSSEEGKGYVKLFFTLLILGAAGYSAIKIIPPYVGNYELQDYIRQQTPYWLTQHSTVDQVRGNILGKATDLDLPVTKDDVKVVVTGGGVTVNIDYTVPVDLKVYTLPLHLTAQSENRSLL